MKTQFFLIPMLILSMLSHAQYAPTPTMPTATEMNRAMPPGQGTMIKINPQSESRTRESSRNYTFTVVLSGDTTFQDRTKINIDEKIHFIEVKQGKRKRIVKPMDTKCISRITGGGKTLVGIPTDSCWLFKIRAGKLNLFSDLAEEEAYRGIAFQQSNGPIMPLSYDNLLPYMTGDKELMECLNEQRFVAAVMMYNRKK